MPRERYTYRTRFDTPGAYELALTAALMGILGRGVHDLSGIVAALATADVRPPGAASWTEAAFVDEMRRLGAGPDPGPLGS
jgi:hypothetical protein